MVLKMNYSNLPERYAKLFSSFYYDYKSRFSTNEVKLVDLS